MAFLRLIGSPGFPMGEADLAGACRALDRPRLLSCGFLRHLLAIVTAPSREKRLRHVTAPTLVLHGADDPLIPAACGRATAAAIPGAKLVTIPGMGHDLPLALEQIRR